MKTADGIKVVHNMIVWHYSSKNAFRVDLNISNYKRKIHCRSLSKKKSDIDIMPSDLFSSKDIMLWSMWYPYASFYEMRAHVFK